MTATPLILPGPTTVHRRGDLLAAGISEGEIRRRLTRAGWQRLTLGRYLAEELAPMRPEQRHALQTMAELSRFTSPLVMASHVSAATLHGLPVIGDPLNRVELVRHGRSGARTTRRCRLRAALVPEADRTTIAGVAVTSLPRTLVDLARSAPRTTALAAADHALREGLVTGAGIVDAWLRISSAARGMNRARRILSLADGRAESPGESWLRLDLLDSGIGPLELQPDVFDADGRFVGRPDAALIEEGVLLEFDGDRKYTRDRAEGETMDEVIGRERQRERQLLQLRWEVERFIWQDLRHPQRIAHRVRQAAAARAGHRHPAGSIRTREPVVVEFPPW